MKPEEFVRFAGLLTAQHPHNDAARRSAVSRAYYGAYHATVEFLISLGFQVNKEHPDAVRHLQSSDSDEAQSAGSLLNDLYNFRRDADYRLNSAEITLELARQCVEDAETVLRRLQKCAVDRTECEKMKSAIQNWRELIGR